MDKHGKSMKTIKGPAVFLAQFVDKKPPSIHLMECVNGLRI